MVIDNVGADGDIPGSVFRVPCFVGEGQHIGGVIMGEVVEVEVLDLFLGDEGDGDPFGDFPAVESVGITDESLGISIQVTEGDMILGVVIDGEFGMDVVL